MGSLTLRLRAGYQSWLRLREIARRLICRDEGIRRLAVLRPDIYCPAGYVCAWDRVKEREMKVRREGIVRDRCGLNRARMPYGGVGVR